MLLLSETFATFNTLTNHITTHTGMKDKPFSCDNCQESFAWTDDLDNHKMSHTREYQYSCFVCQKGFTDESSLAIHVIMHTGEIPFCF